MQLTLIFGFAAITLGGFDSCRAVSGVHRRHPVLVLPQYVDWFEKMKLHRPSS